MSSPINNRKVDRRIIKTKKLLKQVMLQLMSEKPLDHITISLLCEYAQINRNTFYYHYVNIDELLDDMIQDNLESLNELSTGITDFYRSQSICIIYDFIFRNKTLYITLLLKNMNVNFYSALREQNKNNVIPALISFNPNIPQNKIALVTTFIADTFLSTFLRWLSLGYEKAPEDEIELLISLLEHGLFGTL